MSFNPDKAHTPMISLQKDRLETLSIYFLNNPLEEVQSFKLQGLMISHIFSVSNHISKLASKTSHRLGFLHHAKFVLGTLEFLSIYKDFIHSLVEHRFPL